MIENEKKENRVFICLHLKIILSYFIGIVNWGQKTYFFRPHHKLQSKCKPKIYRNTCRTILFPDKSELLWSSLAPKLRIRVFGIFVCLHCSELLLQGLLLGYLRKQDKQGKISYIN